MIDHLKHDFVAPEKQLVNFVHELSDNGIDNIKMDNHGKLRERMTTFRKILREIKNEFHKFEKQWM